MAYRDMVALQALTRTGISGTSTGSTLIETIDIPVRFVALFINIEVTTLTGTVTTVPTVSIGTNATSYNNLLSASALTGVTVSNRVIQFSSTALATSVTGGTGIYANVTVAATGVSLVYTMRVSVLGFYF
jgi:hypothetical protein